MSARTSGFVGSPLENCTLTVVTRSSSRLGERFAGLRAQPGPLQQVPANARQEWRVAQGACVHVRQHRQPRVRAERPPVCDRPINLDDRTRAAPAKTSYRAAIRRQLVSSARAARAC